MATIAISCFNLLFISVLLLFTDGQASPHQFLFKPSFPLVSILPRSTLKYLCLWIHIKRFWRGMFVDETHKLDAKWSSFYFLRSYNTGFLNINVGIWVGGPHTGVRACVCVLTTLAWHNLRSKFYNIYIIYTLCM